MPKLDRNLKTDLKGKQWLRGCRKPSELVKKTD